MDICVIGAGHVGLVTGACLADLGHMVVMVDKDAKRITNLKRATMPYYEPGLEELVERGVREKRLSGSTVARGISKISSIKWSKDLKALRTRAAARKKLIFWLHIVGDLEGAL